MISFGKRPQPRLRPQQSRRVDLATYERRQDLTAAELTTLKAALDRLIPNDDLGPGANEIGVFVYIDRAIPAGIPTMTGHLSTGAGRARHGGGLRRFRRA